MFNLNIKLKHLADSRCESFWFSGIFSVELGPDSPGHPEFQPEKGVHLSIWDPEEELMGCCTSSLDWNISMPKSRDSGRMVSYRSDLGGKIRCKRAGKNKNKNRPSEFCGA